MRGQGDFRHQAKELSSDVRHYPAAQRPSPTVAPSEAQSLIQPPEIPQSAEAKLDVPDISGELRSELAALVAYFAERIAAARLGLAPAAVIKAIVTEQTVAMRALIDRWHEAGKTRQTEQPVGPSPRYAQSRREPHASGPPR